MIWQSAFFLLLILHPCLAQEVPQPIHTIAGDEATQAKDLISGQSGTKFNVGSATDRFGRTGGAIKFNGQGSYIRIPVKDDLSTSRTFSFWTYIGDPGSIGSGAKILGTNAGDQKDIMGYCLSGSATILEGVGRNKATVGSYRTITKKDGTIYPWYLWAYKPIMFDEQGWYHIVQVRDLNFTKTYLWKPSGKMECEFDYMGLQNTEIPKSQKVELLLGARGSSASPIDILDDINIYNVSFNEQQVKNLHNLQSPLVSGKVYRFQMNDLSNTFYFIEDEKSNANNASVLGLRASENTSGGSHLWIAFKRVVNNKDYWVFQNCITNKYLAIQKNSAIKDLISYHPDETNGLEVHLWEVLQDGNGAMILQNKSSKLYLGKPSADKLVIKQSGAVPPFAQVQFERVDMGDSIQIDRFYRISNESSQLYISSAKNQIVKGSNLVQNDESNSGGLHLWRFEKDTDDYSWIIRNAVSKNVIEFSGNTDNLGDGLVAKMNEYNLYNPNRNQKWFVFKDRSDKYRIVSYNSGKFLTVKNASKDAGVALIQWQSGQSNSQWTLDPVQVGGNISENQAYRIQNLNSQLFLHTANNGTDMGTGVQQNAEASSDITHLWNFKRNPDKYSWKIQQFFSGNTLEIQGGSSEFSNGANILVNQDLGYSLRQQWIIFKDKTNQFRMVASNSGKLLVIKDASIDKGSSAIQWEGAQSNGQWKFDVVNFLNNDISNGGVYRIKNMSSSKYLYPLKFEQVNSTILSQQNASSSGAFDLWRFDKGDIDNSWRIVNIIADKPIGIVNSSINLDGSVARINDNSQKDFYNQWYLYKDISGNTRIINSQSKQLLVSNSPNDNIAQSKKGGIASQWSLSPIEMFNPPNQEFDISIRHVMQSSNLCVLKNGFVTADRADLKTNDGKFSEFAESYQSIFHYDPKTLGYNTKAQYNPLALSIDVKNVFGSKNNMSMISTDDPKKTVSLISTVLLPNHNLAKLLIYKDLLNGARNKWNIADLRTGKIMRGGEIDINAPGPNKDLFSPFLPDPNFVKHEANVSFDYYSQDGWAAWDLTYTKYKIGISNISVGQTKPINEDGAESIYTVKVYPNPVSDRIHIAMDSKKGTRILLQFSDVQGRLLLEQKKSIVNGANEISIDIASLHLASAVYLLKLTNESGDLIYSGKIFVRK